MLLHCDIINWHAEKKGGVSQKRCVPHTHRLCQHSRDSIDNTGSSLCLGTKPTVPTRVLFSDVHFNHFLLIVATLLLIMTRYRMNTGGSCALQFPFCPRATQSVLWWHTLLATLLSTKCVSAISTDPSNNNEEFLHYFIISNEKRNLFWHQSLKRW